MNTPLRSTGAALALLVLSSVPGGAAAQTYKCTNAAGKVTYSGKACAELGLKDAGPVRDSLQVTPAYRPTVPPQAAKPTEGKPPPAPAPRAAEPAAEPAKTSDEENPDKRCFKTKAGIRCNAKPDEKAG